MRVNRIVFIFSFVFFFKANSQRIHSLDANKTYIDSIINVNKSTSSDSIRALNNFRISLLFLKAQNLEKYREHLKLANSQMMNFPFLKDVSIYYNSYEYYFKNDIDGFGKQLVKANNALKKYKTIEGYRLRTLVLQNYGIVLQMKSKEKEYMDLLVNEAIPIAKKSGDNEIISTLYKGVGNVFMNTNQREKANEYLKQAEYYIEKKSEKKSPTLLESKVDTYITYAENLVEIGNLDEAQKKLNKAYFYLENKSESNLNAAYYYVKGIFYAKKNQNEEALKHFELGIKIAEKTNNLFMINRILYKQYDVYFKLKDYPKAKEILEYLLEKNPLVVDKKNNYYELAKVYEAMGDSEKAYLNIKKYNVLNDSLNKSMYQNEIIELEANFNKVENENKITLLESQKEKALIVAKNNNIKSLFFGLISILLFIILLLFWKFNKNQKKLSFQKEINYKQALLTMENKQKLVVTNALLEGEEIERERIARDLHDGLGSMLSGLKMHLNKAEQNETYKLSEISSLLDVSIKEVRNISQNLMPETLLRLGLEHALKDLCYSLSNKESNVEFQFLVENYTIPKNKEIVIYRIIQELVNNALKYAKATEILISCTQNSKIFYITVEDNGIGFNVDEVKQNNGMGLKNVMNRFDFLEGKIEIDSKRNKGTAIYIEIKNEEQIHDEDI